MVVSPQHRDAIHTELLTALTRIGDVWLLIERGDHVAAQRTSRELRGAMRLLDDLGWDPEADGDEFTITMRPPELAAVIYLLQSQTAGLFTREIEDVELARTLLRALAARDRGLRRRAHPDRRGGGRMQPLTISRAERDALWQLIHMLLASIGDIFTAVDAGEVNEARMLRHRYRDLMRLLDDIGWSHADAGAKFAITMDPDALMRALARLHERAIDLIYEHADGRPIDPDVLQMAVIGASACDTILIQLAHASAGGEAS